MPIQRIEIENFKSIKKLSLEIASINILVGPNGVGKSNLIAFFSLLKNMFAQNLQTYIGTHGKANGFLHFGKATSDFLSGGVYFRNDWGTTTNSYDGTLIAEEVGMRTIREKCTRFDRWIQTIIDRFH